MIVDGDDCYILQKPGDTIHTRYSIPEESKRIFRGFDQGVFEKLVGPNGVDIQFTPPKKPMNDNGIFARYLAMSEVKGDDPGPAL
jgi:hypothetical protein